MNISLRSLSKAVRQPIQTADFLYRRTQIAAFNRMKATYIFEEEWDLLVVLDACRYDLMEDVAAERDLGFEVGSVFSPASITGFWMERNFSERFAVEKRDTAYVVAAPWSETKLSADSFAVLDEVWSYAFDEELGTIPPEAVLDRAVDVGRNDDPDRMIVHFMQPHFPAINYPGLGSELAVDNDVGWPDSIWNRLENGEVSETAVREAYRDNLVYVLDYVETLLNNVDAPRTVITADHGNAFGERGLYGHPANYCTEELRRVPWCETEAHDSGEYTPRSDWIRTEVAREDQLHALGYL